MRSVVQSAFVAWNIFIEKSIMHFTVVLTIFIHAAFGVPISPGNMKFNFSCYSHANILDIISRNLGHFNAHADDFGMAVVDIEKDVILSPGKGM